MRQRIEFKIFMYDNEISLLRNLNLTKGNENEKSIIGIIIRCIVNVRNVSISPICISTSNGVYNLSQVRAVNYNVNSASIELTTLSARCF